MSLMIVDVDDEIRHWSQVIFDRQMERQPQLQYAYDTRRKRRMMEDIQYNLELLRTAVQLDDPRIFEDHAQWIADLLIHRMQDLGEDAVRGQLVMHYEIMQEAAVEFLEADEAGMARKVLDRAVQITKAGNSAMAEESQRHAVPQAELKEQYLEKLLASDHRGAAKLIENALDGGTPLSDIYMHVFAAAMADVGCLWQRGQITVDKEHYCTAATQNIMAQLYPRIFALPRVGRTILACTVGNELHEMGIRMLCDVFEVYGWDSIYLGASLPPDAITASVSEHCPDLVALSVTMPHYLPLGRDVLKALQTDCDLSRTKVAVGGRAFQLAPELPQQWGADVTADNAVDLVRWADKVFGISRPGRE